MLLRCCRSNNDASVGCDTNLQERFLGLLVGYVQSLETVRCGKTKRDKLKILVNRVLFASYPLSSVSYGVFHRPLFEPRNLVKDYRCKYGRAVFACPGGNSELQFLNSFEPDVKKVVSQFCTGDAVDVGANFGLYTVMMSNSVSSRGRVLAIEPDPSYYRFLAKNVLMNRCENVIPLNIAAWSKSSRLAMRRHVFGGPMEDSVGEQTGGVIDARALDEVFAAHHIEPGLVKIDVEGAEYEVLRGMERSLLSAGPNVIFEALNQHALAKCTALLEESGFSTKRLPDGNFLAFPHH